MFSQGHHKFPAKGAKTPLLLLYLSAFLFLDCPFGALGQTAATAPATLSVESTPQAAPVSAASSATTDLTVSPEEEIKILDAIDSAQGNASTANKASSGGPVSSSPPPVSPSAGVSVAVSTSGAPVTYPPPEAPTGLSVLILKEGVYLSWTAAPADSAVTAYDVYRSTEPGMGYRKVNNKPVPGAYFLDGALNSSSPPQNGEDYFYVVAASDSRGKSSGFSDELAVSPQGMEIPQTAVAVAAKATPVPTEGEKEINLPDKNLVNLQLPADTQLSIQGYKKIEADLSFQNFPQRLTTGNIGTEQDTTTVNQELVVNLQGKVGKNVDVNVDYSDVNRAGGVDQSKQDISIKYTGEENSPIQDVEFGDLQLLLPNTEFAGFSKNLFGLQAKMKFDDLHLTTFFAQTKGIAETKVFTGNSVQVDKVYQDINFIPNKYFLMTREFLPPNTGSSGNGALPSPNSEQIWVDQGNGQINPSNAPNFGGPNNLFEHWLPGRDYTVDYTTGIITFLRSLPSSARIAVGFTNQNGGLRGLNIFNSGSGPATFPASVPLANLLVSDDGFVGVAVTVTSPSAPTTHAAGYLIKDNNNSSSIGGNSSQNAIALSPLYLVNAFDLGRDKIIPPDQDPNFLFQITSAGSGQVFQTSQGSTQVGAAPVSNPWVYNVNLDLNILTITDSNFFTVPLAAAPNASTSFLWSERPFATKDGFVASGDGTGGTGTNDVYSQTTTPTSLFNIHLRYKTQSNFFNLGRFNIIRGSEAVFLDGRRLRRDVDYFFDYTSGFLDFQDKSILRPDSQIVVTYEYAPFGSFSQNNILGARAEYDVNDRFFLGSTFLESDAQQPIDVPQVGGTPNSLTLFDADARLDVPQEDVKALTSIIPGLENWTPPISLKLSAEVAQSYFNPDTFNAEGETGVAMLDNMEGIDSVVGPSMQNNSWLVSSAPAAGLVQSPVTIIPVAAPISTNNRTRFINLAADPTPVPQLMEVFQTIGTNGSSIPALTQIPAYGGHVYAQTQNGADLVSVLQFPYSELTNSNWAGLRQVLSTNGLDFSTVTFLQSWIYNDGKPKWIMVDFGVMSEDSNGEAANGMAVTAGSHYFSDPNQYPATVTADTTYALPTFYFPNNPWVSGGPTNYSNPLNFTISPEGVTTIPGMTSATQEGYGVGQNSTYVTEDMNGDNALETNDAYYEYGIQATWQGWQQVKIPFSPTASPGSNMTPDGVSYFFTTTGTTPNPTIVRSVRVWVTGTSPQTISGDFYMENLSFTHNLWQLQVDPAAVSQNPVTTVNTGNFDANSISADQFVQTQGQSLVGYFPDVRFLTLQAGQDQSAVTLKEKSLDIHYNLSDANMYPVTLNTPSGPVSTSVPAYYASHIFSQGLDLTDYQDLRFDLNIRSFQTGDRLFLRVGNDQEDYYEYDIQLSQAAVSCANGFGNNWGVISIPMNGSGGNWHQVGTPFINRATIISFGIIPNPGVLGSGGGSTGEIWIDNLRATNSSIRSGVARRANAAILLGDPKTPFATINARYRDVDSGFTEMDQTSTHFQHSKQVGADYSSSGVSIFAQPLVTQFSITSQDLYTDPGYSQNPYYFNLPSSHIDSSTGSISYTKDLGPSFGRLTSVRFSESTNYETDTFDPNSGYLSQPGVQGNTYKGEEIATVASTYDAPTKLFFLPIGTNQFTESFSLTHDFQEFTPPNNLDLALYDRTTRSQSYGWTNTTEVVKNLIFTPGFNYSITDAYGNTNSPGASVTAAAIIPSYTTFQDRYQPKAGLVYRGIPGLIPSVDYSGSNSYDYISFTDGERFTSANNLNYSLNLSPGTWFAFLQKINLTVTAGRTESQSSSIPNFNNQRPLSFNQQWLTDAPFDPSYGALTASRSVAHQLNASFKITDAWDVRPTGSWSEQESLLSQGSNAVTQTSETYGFTTVYNKKLVTLPLVMFTVDSTQVQYTHTDSTQWDSSTPPQIANQTYSDLYSVTLPYDINQKAQGNVRFQRTVGYQNGLSTLNVPTYQHDDQINVEYNQRFAPGLEIHIPFTKLLLKLHDALEFKAAFLMEFVNNQSNYVNNQLETEKYRGSVEFDYNALKNLRVGVGLAYETLNNDLVNTNNYNLWQANISGEARF